MKRFRPPASMDLLLDAMCNVFGAVLLAAILIGGLSSVKKLAAPSGGIDRKLFEQKSRELQKLQTELETLQLELSILNAIAPDAPQKSAALDQNKLARYRRQVISANTLADEIESKQLLLRQKQSDRQLQKKFTEAELDREIKKLAGKLAIAPEPEKLPVKSYTDSLQPWRILVKKTHFFNIGSNLMIRRLSPPDNAVKIKSFKLDDEEFFHIRALPEKGVEIDSFDLGKLQIAPGTFDRYFVELLVEYDAVSSAALLVKKLRQNNILYHWRTIPPEGALLRTAQEGRYEVSR